MFPALSNIPAGLNSPYGPYGGVPSGNPANSGLAPPSGINTKNPILDLVLNTVFAGVMGDTPMLRTFGRPKVSDYSYTSMQERQRVSQMVTPDVIASNPMFGSMISGDLGKNRAFQQFVGDPFLSPGGSMGDAFNTVNGRFTKDLAGPGLRNASTNAVLAANIVKNTDKAFLDKDGMYDYRKTYGFDRSETYRNADAYNRVFGGFTSSVDTRDETDRAVELGTLSQTVLEEAERRGDITPEKSQEAREKIQVAESRLQESKNIVPTKMSDFVGKALQEVGSQLGVAPADAPPSSASDAPAVQSETQTGFIDTTGAPYETPSNFPTIAPFYDVAVDPEGTKASEIEPEEVSEEVKQKRGRFDELNKQYQEVKGFLSANEKSPKVGVNKVQSDEIERRLDQIVQEITVLDEQKGQERKSEFNAIKRQIKGDVETAVASAQDTYQDVISTHGTQQQQGLAASTLEDRSRGPMADLAEAPTAENAERQEAARNKFLEVNKMTREAQNLFGQDVPADELMQSVKGLVEGAGGLSTGDVTDLLQRIQATAVVVDMSNEAMVQYFDVLDNMYKGMGVRSGNRANMAQNALLAADASVQSRKMAAEAKGEMYTGPGVGEEAQKIAEYQGRVARSPRNSRALAILTALSDEGAEGEVRREFKSRMEEGDLDGAMDVFDRGKESGAISGDKEREVGRLDAYYNEFGASPEALEHIRQTITAESGKEVANQIMGNATGENISIVSEAAGKQMGDLVFGVNGDDETAEIVNQQLGAGASDKIKEAFGVELSRDELSDPVKMKAKFKEMFAGASDSAIATAQSAFVSKMYSTEGAADLITLIESPEQQQIREENEARMQEIKEEIDTTTTVRSPLMRKLNLGEEIFTGAYETIKRMKEAGVTDFTDPQKFFEAAGGAGSKFLGGAKSWDEMSKADQNSASAAFQIATGQTLEGTTSYLEDLDRIEREAEEIGIKAEEDAKPYYTDSETDKARLKEIRDNAKNAYIDEETKKLNESSLSGAKDDESASGDSEKGSFDSDAALQSLITAIGAVAEAILKNGSDKTASSSGNPDARVENPVLIA